MNKAPAALGAISSSAGGAKTVESSAGLCARMVSVAALVTIALFASTASLPFFSEDLSLQGRVAAYESAWQIFDPAQVPFRPLQHGFFYLLYALAPVEPWIARIPGFVLYFLSALLVADLARQLGCSRRGTWIALVFYLCFPSIKSLAYVAAINAPGRVTCILAGLCLFMRHLERPSARTGIGLLAAQILALGFHQAGVVLVPACFLIAWGLEGAPITSGWATVGRRLREPWLVALFVLALGYALAMSFLWAQRYPQSHPAAVLANFARASLALAPETVRHPAIEGLRQRMGTAGFVFGLATLAYAWLAYLVTLVRARPLSRALFLAAGLDLLLPAVSVGFLVRYAQLAAALCGCAAGRVFDRLIAERRELSMRNAGLAILLVCWAYDTAFDVAEYRHAGVVLRRVLGQAAEARARLGPDVTIALVDLPENWGRERDIPLFNWGTRRALVLDGSPGPWDVLRTKPVMGSTEAELISPEALARLAEERPHAVLVYDPAGERLEEHAAPAREPGG